MTIKNPCQRLEFYPIDIKLKYIPSDEEIAVVRGKLSPSQLLLFDFVEETGFRIMEAIRLTHKDIENTFIILYTRKAKNSNLTPRIIPRPQCLTGNFIDRVFKEWNAYPRFLEDLADWNWHNLRHRRASIWANNNMPIFEIMSRLGHTNMATTMRYLQLLGFTKLSPT
ncbi:MAG: phage integrase family [Geobacteraceae bacterium]|nr:MAG: phage integrase family [Geobacteraceae bacterium]